MFFRMEYDHYENLPLQDTENFSAVKIIENIFAQNIDCGYRLETPQHISTHNLCFG